MKATKRIVSIIVLISMLAALPVVSYCDAEPLRSIPEYTGICSHCGSTSWTLVQQRVKETRSWMTTCSNSDTGFVHRHFIQSYYNDYICNVCAAPATRFDHSVQRCELSYRSLEFAN